MFGEEIVAAALVVVQPANLAEFELGIFALLLLVVHDRG